MSQAAGSPAIRDLRSAILREAAVFAFFVVATIAITWPLARNFRTAVPDPGDPILNAWIIDWDIYALTHSPSHLFDAPIYYPAKYPLAFSENMLGIALFALPFHLFHVPPLALYNLMVLLGFAHAGYGAFVLARMVTRSIPASLAAGIFFAFNAFKFDHMSHLQILWSGWLPLMLAALLALAAKPTLWRAALLSGAFLMNGLTNIHFLLFGGVAIGIGIVFIGFTNPRLGWRFLAFAFGAIALASLLLLPILLPYRTISHQYGAKRIPEEVLSGSANWDDWLRVTSRNLLYSAPQDNSRGRAERQLFPGFLAILLTGYAFVTAPRRERTPGSGLPPPRWLRFIDAAIVLFTIAAWIGAVTNKFVLKPGGHSFINIDNAAPQTMIVVILIFVRLSIRLPRALGGSEGRSLRDVIRDSRFPLGLWVSAIWIVIGILGSFGLNAFFHTFLYRQIEAFSAIRAAARWAIITYVGLIPWMAAGATELIARRRGWRRQAAVAVLLILACVEVWPRVRWEQMVTATPPFYRWLDRERIGPVLELPMHTDRGVEFLYLLRGTAHHVTLLNGTSGWEPPTHERLRWRIESSKLDDTFTRALENYGTKLVVLHVDLLATSKAAVLKWAAAGTTSGRLAFLRRFESGMSGDYVFAVTRNLPEWPRYVDTTWDALGLQPGENFRRLLRGESTYNNATFGHVETPVPYDVKAGPMAVSGWALSPNGIRTVSVLVHGGSRRYTATMYARPDVHAVFPWYANVPQPGFIVKLPRRPKGVPRDTDVQVEIVDGLGRAIRLTDLPIYWN